MVILYGHYSGVNFYPEEMNSGNTLSPISLASIKPFSLCSVLFNTDLMTVIPRFIELLHRIYLDSICIPNVLLLFPKSGFS